MTKVVFTTDFVIVGVTPTRSVVRSIAGLVGNISGQVLRTSATSVRVTAVSKNLCDIEDFVEQIIAAFKTSLWTAATPETAADPVVSESDESAHIRTALEGSFISKWSSFKAKDGCHHLSANTGSAVSSQSSASRGLG